MTIMTIGAQGNPNRTRIPTLSALNLPGEGGPNQDEVLEEEDRAIAGMALYIASTCEPSSMVSLGPGAHGGLARYIGVMKPIHLYLELEAWCSIQETPKPSFQTLLLALDKCGCVRFRKTAGQHPNCDRRMRFKRLLHAPPPQKKKNSTAANTGVGGILQSHLVAMVRPWCGL